MKTELLEQLSEFIEKQDILIKLTENERLHSYRYSEVGVIIAVGDLEEPNVTEISKALKMTKGAVSKITKRLTSKNVIKSYMRPDNNQKVYFTLTEKGKVLYAEHEKRHAMWVDRDMQFLKQFSDTDLERFSFFMEKYNAYLEQKIEKISKNNREV